MIKNANKLSDKVKEIKNLMNSLHLDHSCLHPYIFIFDNTWS
uniref:Uncharacterized protein n=1 Tax=Anguilla anguilla TaxID=7936 RepID=A0A0E9PY24_ANGAN